MYPDGVGVFIFDCSSAHEAYADDALMAHKMNRGPGGKQPKMHDTVNFTTSLPQTMVSPIKRTKQTSTGKLLPGKAKGWNKYYGREGCWMIWQSLQEERR